MAKRKTWIFGGTFGLLIVGGIVALVLYLTGVFSPKSTSTTTPGPTPPPGPSPYPGPNPGPNPESDYYFHITNVRMAPATCRPGQPKYSGIMFDVTTNVPDNTPGSASVTANFTGTPGYGESFDILNNRSPTPLISFDTTRPIPTGLAGNQLIVKWQFGNNPVVTNYIPFTFPSSMTC